MLLDAVENLGHVERQILNAFTQVTQVTWVESNFSVPLTIPSQ